MQLLGLQQQQEGDGALGGLRASLEVELAASVMAQAAAGLAVKERAVGAMRARRCVRACVRVLVL